MSDFIPCRYDFEISTPTIFFYHKKAFHEIDFSVFEEASCCHIVIDEIMPEDLPFARRLMQLCKDQEYMNFAIMGERLDVDVNNVLECYSTQFFDSTNIVFSLNIALTETLPDNSCVGTFVKYDGVIWAQPINAGTFKYENLKNIFLRVEEIVGSIKKLHLTVLQKIIWIDNWFQANIQFLKNKETKDAHGNTYVCNQINEQATVPDVLVNHYGVCEDIATSIKAILTKLKINSEEVQANGHAWIIVEVDKKNYIWDCTHNITRNPHMASNGIKATEYSYEYTLIGKTSSGNKYDEFPNMPVIATDNFSREALDNAIEELKQKKVDFKYSLCAKYDSTIETVKSIQPC